MVYSSAVLLLKQLLEQCKPPERPANSCVRHFAHGLLFLQVLAHIKGMGDACQEPSQYPTTPSLAIPKALVSTAVPCWATIALFRCL